MTANARPLADIDQALASAAANLREAAQTLDSFRQMLAVDAEAKGGVFDLGQVSAIRSNLARVLGEANHDTRRAQDNALRVMLVAADLVAEEA